MLSIFARGKLRPTRGPERWAPAYADASTAWALDERILAVEGGSLFEHWVACELWTRLKYLGPTHRLSCWRTVDGAEVDLIVETPREVIPIEVKYTENPRPQNATGIERFMARYPEVARRGYVVCRAARREQLSRHVQAIPWQEL
jgi:predicted AAA+ superfamily ATPase